VCEAADWPSSCRSHPSPKISNDIQGRLTRFISPAIINECSLVKVWTAVAFASAATTETSRDAERLSMMLVVLKKMKNLETWQEVLTNRTEIYLHLKCLSSSFDRKSTAAAILLSS
jgi:hypothetical protein